MRRSRRPFPSHHAAAAPESFGTVTIKVEGGALTNIHSRRFGRFLARFLFNRLFRGLVSNLRKAV